MRKSLTNGQADARHQLIQTLYKQLNWPLERLAKNTCKIKSKNKSTINVMNSFEQ